jgi:hypothetical protein
MFGWLKKRRSPEVVGEPNPIIATDDSEDATFYSPHWHEFDDDGTLHIRVSMYRPHEHASGRMTVKTDGASYPFWCWVIEQPEYNRSIRDTELAEIRKRFERSTSRPA